MASSCSTPQVRNSCHKKAHAPRQPLLVHGEPDALEGLRQRVRSKGWSAYVPDYLEKVELAA